MSDNYNLNNQPTGQPVKNYGLAIASMVCGIVGVVLFCVPYLSIILGVLAIIFGAVMLNANKENPNKQGKGMAITGVVLGIITVGIFILVIAGIASAMSSLENFMN